MIEKPGAIDVARPSMVIVATAVLDEPHITWVLISRLVPSENAPVAVNCWVIPGGVLGILGLAGFTDMEKRVAKVTETIVVAEMFPEAAVMMAAPGLIPVSKPVLSTVATKLLDELQMT